jgi:hypothetical protein
LDHGSAEETSEIQFPKLHLSGSPCGNNGIEIVEELCETFGSTRSVEEEDENEQEMVPIFAKTYEALQKVTAFFYAQSGNDADHENILSLEKSYFQLRQNSAKKQRTMHDYFVKKLFFNVVYSC